MYRVIDYVTGRSDWRLAVLAGVLCLLAGLGATSFYHHALALTVVVAALGLFGLVMAIAHRELPAWGVQFHPESVLTPEGEILIANFLRLSSATTPMVDASR